MIGIGVRTVNGAVEVLDLPTPRDPMAGELLLEVMAAGIGRWDSLIATGGWDVGVQFPAALGVEAAGRVIAVGPDVNGFRVGDIVLVHEAPLPGGSGTWAEQVLVHASGAALCPPNLTPDVAAGLPVAALTAQQALDNLHVGAHTRLLVVGSGPTAALAVQLAVLAGASVVAAAGAAHADRLRGLGAIDVIDSHVDHWAEATHNRFDAVLIAAAGTASDGMSLLDDDGRLCSITSDAPQPARGITTTNLYVRPDGEGLTKLAARAAAGELSSEVRPITVDQGPAAADLVASGRSRAVKYVIEFVGASSEGTSVG